VSISRAKVFPGGRHLRKAALQGEQDILGLHVGVYDPLAVDVVEGAEELLCHFLYLWQRKRLLLPRCVLGSFK
jgi:hypothetical protein